MSSLPEPQTLAWYELLGHILIASDTHSRLWSEQDRDEASGGFSESTTKRSVWVSYASIMVMLPITATRCFLNTQPAQMGTGVPPPDAHFFPCRAFSAASASCWR
jgi:hypothetical protein